MKKIKNEELKEIALKCSLFSHLSDQEVDSLLKESRVVDVKEHEILANLGQPANEFFLTLCGELKVLVSSQKGEEKILHIIHARETFATVLMFLEKPIYPASIIALEDSRVLAIPNAKYKHILSQSPKACFGLLADYAYRNRQLVDEIENITLQNAKYRVLSYLKRDAKTNMSGDLVVSLRISKQAIASRMSIKPETLSRILSTLKKDGIIEQSEKKITLLGVDWIDQYLDDR